MKPVVLRTERLYLDQLVTDDRELMNEYCRDPIFETYMLTPWPYEPEHADSFIGNAAPQGWDGDTEYTWAIRWHPAGELLGVIGYRKPTNDVGYWLGSPHRGQGVMTEAAGAVIDWLFAQGRSVVDWECIIGNLASASLARTIGFTYTGTGPSALRGRNDTTASCWHGALTAQDSREPKPGWPIP